MAKSSFDVISTGIVRRRDIVFQLKEILPHTFWSEKETPRQLGSPMRAAESLYIILDFAEGTVPEAFRKELAPETFDQLTKFLSETISSMFLGAKARKLFLRFFFSFSSGKDVLHFYASGYGKSDEVIFARNEGLNSILKLIRPLVASTTGSQHFILDNEKQTWRKTRSDTTGDRRP